MINHYRRRWMRNNVASLAAAGIAGALPMRNLLASTSAASTSHLLSRKIPGTDEFIPVIGMGTWITFDVPDQPYLRSQRAEVLQRFVELGGGMVDSSPMYGYAEEVLGESIATLETDKTLFNASKIWTPFAAQAKVQMRDTEELWDVKSMDLMYVHNLLDWQSHLPTLRRWKDEDRIRYVGLSTSHGRRHDELEKLLKTEEIDFVQLTLNIEDTEAEERLIPLAQDKGIAVVVNRPFQRGALFSKYADKQLPGIAEELGCQNWAQFFLMYVVSHPGVTCAIPATSQVAHMQQNMETLRLPLPDVNTRASMREAL